jgi:uncharacterized protein (TIGR02246 family)
MRNRSFPLLAASAALALAACSAPSAATTGTAADEQQIRGLADAYAKAFSTHSAAPVGAILADDYEDVTPAGVHEQGPKAVTDQMTKDMAMMPAGGSMTATTTYVKWISDKAAVAGGTYMMGGPSMPGMPSKGAWMGVAVKKDSTWKMVSSLGADDDSEMMAAAAAAATKVKPKGK